LSGSGLISILDYGSGNIRSAQRALEHVGLTVEVTSSYDRALGADGLVVPGVGAFGNCINQLKEIRGDEAIKERNKLGRPTLGICVGMQVLFEKSAESQESGLGLITGVVEKLSAPVLPHIGWNKLHTDRTPKLLTGLIDERFYFVHSYAVKKSPQGSAFATSNYGENFLAVIEHGSLSAVQFHPEKSGEAGLQLLRNWADSI
jgi:glutamine amidotransferase